MLLRTVSVLLAALVLASAAASGQLYQTSERFPESTRLDDASMRDAVALGEKHRPEPYWLYPRPGGGKATVAVYTPFIRLALAAYTATQRGERLSINKLPPWIVESDVHVVVRPQDTTIAGKPFPEDPTLTRTPITQIVLVPRGRPAPYLDGIPPKWMTTDLSYLDVIGGAPFADAVAAAAFDPALMVQNVDVYGFWRKENRFFPSHGFVDANERSNWR